ncbi:M56 family metallopeptidase [Prosthecobacter sp.]|uniref:M56 family metallopeptidase n=1 Tax=Prosthecobacter sp. TaxID=1965333 RepID=UPI003784F9BB
MNTLFESIEVWAQGLVLLSWKGTLLALAVGFVMLLLHRHLSPAWRHGLWLLVFLRFLVPDLGHFFLSLDGLAEAPAIFEPASEPVPVAEEMVAVAEPVVESPFLSDAQPLPEIPTVTKAVVQQPLLVRAVAPSWTMREKLCLVWLCGVAMVVAVMTMLHLRLKRRIRRDASEAFSEIRAVLDEACRLAHVRHAPRLMVTDAVRAPSLFGVLRPMILLPKQVAAGRDAAALRLILLHELAHLKRRDLWAQILSSCVIALHWFNPFVWIIARRLRAEAEMAADAHALGCTDAKEAHRFGEMLLGFSRYATTGWMMWLASATLLGISENKKDLRRRIEGLMDIARGRRTRWGVGLGAFMVLAAAGLTRAPAEDAKKVTAEKPAEVTDNLATTVVNGIVVDEQDKPVSGAVVKLSINLLSHFESSQRVTGADGKFSFDEVPKAASLNLRASQSDYAESNFVTFSGVSLSQERRLVLPRVSWIRGRITDKRDGRPIKDALVLFGVENKASFLGPYDWKHPFAHTNEAGEYRLAVKLADVNGIIVRAWAPDMAVQSRSVKFTGREAEFDAALEPVHRLPGRVVDALGEPVKDAMVWVVEDVARLDESSRPITLETMRSSDRVNMTLGKYFTCLDYSKDDGSVQLPDADPLLKGKLWVVAMHPKAGFARMRAVDFKAGAVFKLEKWASMSGKMIRSDGSPLADATVSIYAKGDADLMPKGDTLKIDHNIKVTTDPAGGYKIDRLLPGATFNGVTIGGGNTRREFLPITPITVTSGPQGVRQISLGRSLASQAAGGVRVVQGRIVLPEGHGFRGEDYSCHFSITSRGAPVAAMPRPDKDGRFASEALPPGIYELSVFVTPRGTGMELSRDVGRWMQFKIEPGAGQAPLRVADIVFTKEDLTPRPRSANPVSQLPVFVEGADGKIEITTVDADRKPVPGVKIQIVDLVDFTQSPMNLSGVPGVTGQIVSDERGKAIVLFPRNPAAGRRAGGVQVTGTAPDGSKSRRTEMMDGRTYELRVYPETPVSLSVSSPIASWAASSSVGLLTEGEPLKSGGIKGRLALEHGGYFVVQGTTADGKILFSEAVAAAKNHAEEVTGEVALEPGVEIEGKIEGLPANDQGTGGVVANVYVRSSEVTSEIRKGSMPAVPWTAWAPVGPDGRFHFKGMPRGMVSLRGLGKGWITRGPLSIDSAAMVDTRGMAGKAVVTLTTRPCKSRTLRVLLPDGSPAAGATVRMDMPGIGMLATSRGHMHAEDPEKHAQFKKAAWMGLRTVADDQGQVILENQPTGRGYCQVYWVDPKTQHPHGASASFTLEDTETNTPLEVKVQER